MGTRNQKSSDVRKFFELHFYFQTCKETAIFGPDVTKNLFHCTAMSTAVFFMCL